MFAQFGSWLVGVLLKYGLQYVQKFFVYLIDMFKFKKQVQQNDSDYHKVIDEAQKTIDQAKSEHRELTEAEKEKIRQDKIKLEEGLFNEHS